MDVLYIANHVVFSLFITLFLVEIGMAFTGMLFYELYPTIKKYLIPMWEINGTFAIFYIVSFEAIYPKLLISVGFLYLVPVMFAALLFILRNAFISYSEYANNVTSKKTYFMVYSISTLIIGFLVISIFSSAMSGIGININTNTIYLLQFLFNPFNILIFVSLVLLGFCITAIVLSINKMRISASVSLFTSILIGLIGISTYTKYLLNNIFGDIWILYSLVIILLITLFTLILYIKKVQISNKLILPATFFIILIISISQYPYVYGNQLYINTYLTQSVNQVPIMYITTFGILFLSISISYLIYVYNKKEIIKEK